MRAFFIFSRKLLSLNRPNHFMKKKLSQFKDFLSELTSFAVVLLCLGITVQLLIGESLLGWDVVGNITKSIGNIVLEPFLISLIFRSGRKSTEVKIYFFSN